MWYSLERLVSRRRISRPRSSRANAVLGYQGQAKAWELKRIEGGPDRVGRQERDAGGQLAYKKSKRLTSHPSWSRMTLLNKDGNLGIQKCHKRIGC